MRYSGSIAKWPILVAALLITLGSLANRIAAFGTLAAGFWIAFAILHAGDRLGKQLDSTIASRDNVPTDKP